MTKEAEYADEDSNYNYICEYGHRVLTRNPNYLICTAKLLTGPCGGDIDFRLIPMRLIPTENRVDALRAYVEFHDEEPEVRDAHG